jgi:hypothetical protein
MQRWLSTSVASPGYDPNNFAGFTYGHKKHKKAQKQCATFSCLFVPFRGNSSFARIRFAWHSAR